MVPPLAFATDLPTLSSKVGDGSKGMKRSLGVSSGALWGLSVSQLDREHRIKMLGQSTEREVGNAKEFHEV